MKGPGEAPRPQGKVQEEKIPPPVSIREVTVTPRVSERPEAGLGSAVAEESPLILIEGHADERGTNEYNLALGERRAKTIRDFLVAGDIHAKRVSIISYGEERPFVLGHDESAWKWNRRGHVNLGSP
jgi:hypothetical protein